MDFIKANVLVDKFTGCWNWKKSTNSAGYGQFTRNKKYWTTHRFVYTQIYGEIPSDLVVRHKCHNPRCCNPEHLIIGTNQDNWYDSAEIHREAISKTKLSSTTLSKFTDPITRIFDTESYRKGCLIAGWQPKV